MAREERSAGVVVYRANAPASGCVADPLYLLLDYGKYWDYPKGHVEKGEDDLTAALRELREETGLTDARVLPGFHQDITYFFRHRKNGLVRKTVTFFMAETQSSKVTLSEEHVGYAFLPFDRALIQLNYPTAKALLQAAHQHLLDSAM